MKKAGMIGAIAAATILAGCGKNSRSLHIYTWSDYIAPEVIAEFEKANDCKVVVDTFDSNETMYAKLKAGGSGYDIITPSSYLVPLMARENLITKLDHTKMPNVKANFDPQFADQILDKSFTYNVPYAVTYTGFMYAKDKIPEGADVESWKILENPALKGRITLLDDIREVIGAGLMSLGHSINSTDPAEIDAAVADEGMAGRLAFGFQGIHVGHGNVMDGDDALKPAVPMNDRKRGDVLLRHHPPRVS